MWGLAGRSALVARRQAAAPHVSDDGIDDNHAGVAFPLGVRRCGQLYNPRRADSSGRLEVSSCHPVRPRLKCVSDYSPVGLRLNRIRVVERGGVSCPVDADRIDRQSHEQNHDENAQ